MDNGEFHCFRSKKLNGQFYSLLCTTCNKLTLKTFQKDTFQIIQYTALHNKYSKAQSFKFPITPEYPDTYGTFGEVDFIENLGIIDVA